MTWKSSWGSNRFQSNPNQSQNLFRSNFNQSPNTFMHPPSHPTNSQFSTTATRWKSTFKATPQQTSSFFSSKPDVSSLPATKSQSINNSLNSTNSNSFDSKPNQSPNQSESNPNQLSNPFLRPSSQPTDNPFIKEAKKSNSTCKAISPPPDSYFSSRPDVNSLPTTKSQSINNSSNSTNSNSIESKLNQSQNPFLHPPSQPTDNPFTRAIDQAKSTCKAIPPPPDSYFSMKPDVNSLPTTKSQQKVQTIPNDLQNPNSIKVQHQQPPHEEHQEQPTSNQSDSNSSIPTLQAEREKSDDKKSVSLEIENGQIKDQTCMIQKKFNLKRRAKNIKKRKRRIQNVQFNVTSQFRNSPIIVNTLSELFNNAHITINEVLNRDISERELVKFNHYFSGVIKNQVELYEHMMNSPFGQFNPYQNQCFGFNPYSPFTLP